MQKKKEKDVYDSENNANCRVLLHTYMIPKTTLIVAFFFIYIAF
jgi:hypothetical protein